MGGLKGENVTENNTNMIIKVDADYIFYMKTDLIDTKNS